MVTKQVYFGVITCMVGQMKQVSKFKNKNYTQTDFHKTHQLQQVSIPLWN